MLAHGSICNFQMQILLSLITFLGYTIALDNGLALLPPMGWNSWNHYACNVSETLIKQTVDALVKTGMKEAGYTFVNIDDCWQAPKRDAQGNLQPNTERFPNGMKSLADYVHAQGMKIGIYSDAGTKTCQGFPGSWGYEKQDALQFASWGIDYLKLDWCDMELSDPEIVYPRMRDALNATGRPIVFSMCEWGLWFPWDWAQPIANLWRTDLDISDDWFSLVRILETRILFNLHDASGPGGWNDPDMLEVGNGGMTTTEYITQFSFWSLLAAPLIAGNDVTDMDSTTLEILTNQEVIDINQDALGKEGARVEGDWTYDIWVRNLADGSKAVLLFNRSEVAQNITLDWSTINLPSEQQLAIRDLWLHKDLGVFTNNFTASPEGHGVVYLKVQVPE